MARHRPAHAKSGFGRYTPPRRGARPAHAAPDEPGMGLGRRAGLAVGGGVLVTAGFMGLGGVPAGAATSLANACILGSTTDAAMNTACSLTDSTSTGHSSAGEPAGLSANALNTASDTATLTSNAHASAGDGAGSGNLDNTAAAIAASHSSADAAAGDGDDGSNIMKFVKVNISVPKR